MIPEPARNASSPLWKLLDPSFDPPRLAGGLALIGGTAEGLKDFKPTPLDGDMAGIGSTRRCSSRSSTASFYSDPIG